MHVRWFAASVTVVVLPCSAQVSGGVALRQFQTIPLENVEGRMDHLTLDTTGQTLFLAALGNNSLEVVDLRAAKRIQQIEGLKEPQVEALLEKSLSRAKLKLPELD